MKKSDLELFKKSLLERKAQILKNISDSTSDINELKSSGAVDEMDIASINTDSNLEYSLNQKQSEELKDIEYSLKKISAGTYGSCEMCEEEIGLARLRAKPTARYCISCREIVEKGMK